MSTRAIASALMPCTIETVWKEVRRFDFPERVFEGTSVVIEGPQHVGATRKVSWESTAQWQRHRLLSVNDLDFVLEWEVIEEYPSSEALATLSRLSLLRVTEDDSTFVRWEMHFSASTPQKLVAFHTNALHQNLREMRRYFTGTADPCIQHVHEGPSSRVIWLATELNAPLEVRVQDMDVGTSHVSDGISLCTSAEVSMLQPAGELMPVFAHGELTLIESGAIIMYMLSTYDKRHELHPVPTASGAEQATFYQWMFFAAATLDPLLMEAYVNLYVRDGDKKDEECVRINRLKWDQALALRLGPQLSNNPYICGSRFSAADVMLGHTIYFASVLGWVERGSVLDQYLRRIRRRPGFARAYEDLVD